ncbi:MAG: flagellar FlbD family protein [Peptococcaceae bacterium]|nr:flagellar FlbD family protein [Peptococcaceae bacterium]
MIYVSRLNNKEFALNPDLIETIEATPDTVITLTNDNKYIVRESIEEIISRIADFRRRCHPDFRGGKNIDENSI